jgi:CheY-like chemotaxis protein
MPHALIIDDNRNNIDVLVMLLEQEGVSGNALQTVRQVEEVLEQPGQIDVIFLDLEFPTGDGFQILDILKSNPHFQKVPIIAYSVHTSEIDVRGGIDGFGQAAEWSELSRTIRADIEWTRSVGSIGSNPNISHL